MIKYFFYLTFAILYLALHPQALYAQNRPIAHSDVPDLPGLIEDIIYSDPINSNSMENHLEILLSIEAGMRFHICDCDSNSNETCHAEQSSECSRCASASSTSSPSHCESCCNYFCTLGDSNCRQRCVANECGLTNNN